MTMKVTYLSQLDKRWAAKKLGPGPLTIKSHGCTTTMISMMSYFVGKPMNPDQIAANVGWYTGPKYPAGPCLVLWSKLAIPGLKFAWRQQGFDKARIEKDLADPKMLVGLQVNGGKHWVWLLSKAGGDYNAADPLGGVRCQVFKKYKNITGSVHFKIA